MCVCLCLCVFECVKPEVNIMCVFIADASAIKGGQMSVCVCMYVQASGANASQGGRMTPTVSSTTPSASSMLQAIQSLVMPILQESVSSGATLDIPLSVYASILADAFYAQLQSRTASGTIALTETVLAELSTFVRQNVDVRRRRTSL